MARVHRGIPSSRTREVLAMVGRIVVIVFLVEAIVMVALSGWDLRRDVLAESLLDASWLTLISAPLIYLLVGKPFVEAARLAEAALAREVEVKAEKAAELERVLADVRHLLLQNEVLRESQQKTNARIADSNEQILQQIGADLHDGPAQLLAYALLRLSRFAPLIEAQAGEAGLADLAQLRKALTDALAEVRAISAGLTLPELGEASLAQTIRLAASWHEGHASRVVALDLDALPAQPLPLPLKVCVYRFVQEALTNAARHANATRLDVRANLGERLDISVSDDGTGFDPAQARKDGLGLLGMRARIEAAGGSLTLEALPGQGTTVTASFPLSALAKGAAS
jgi:signal transduction histidine kinase